MRALSATIGIDLIGDDPATVYLNIEKGCMSAGLQASHAPSIRIIQDGATLRWLMRETDGSLTALLGALAGLGGEMKLTHKRMLDLEAVDGLIRFEVTGDNGFTLLTHFGTREMPAEPDAVIRMSEDSYAAMRSGRIDPQTAFLDDSIQTEGDLQKSHASRIRGGRAGLIREREAGLRGGHARYIEGVRQQHSLGHHPTFRDATFSSGRRSSAD